MVVMPVTLVTRQRWISSAATSRSQRVISTLVAPSWIGVFMFACIPVRWNIGSTPSTTASLEPAYQTPAPVLVASRFACVSMAPLGCPVVPEV